MSSEHVEQKYRAFSLLAGWIAALADQVKNPVAGISAAASIIEKQMVAFRSKMPWDPEIVEEAIRLMQHRLTSFDNYLIELSGFTRPVVLHAEEINIVREWPQMKQFVLRRMAGEVHLEMNCDPEAGVVFADIDKLRIMITAAILNSVEVAGAHKIAEINVSISAFYDEKLKQDGRLISIRDQGPGFTEESLLQGLMPFFTTKEAGTGLGLAMIDKYARAHGGWARISNWSVDGVVSGAEVQMFLPKMWN